MEHHVDTLAGAHQAVAVAHIADQVAQVTAVAFTPDSTWFWTASQLARAPGRALLQSWSVATGELLIERAVEGPVVRALLPIAERQVAIGRADGVV